MTSKPILCLDFDGVIHSYTSGWKGADVIPDPPVDGAIEFIWNVGKHFKIAILSTRSHQEGGIPAMMIWLAGYLMIYALEEKQLTDLKIYREKFDAISWPIHKPPATISIDDRALTFEGVWPDIETLKNFKPWNKRS